MNSESRFYGKLALIFLALATVAVLTVFMTAFVFYKITIQ